MVNIEDFIKRLEIILDYYSLNASSFADKIGVQRSSMSHLLSGRNKPSLDFILKISEVFPQVDLYWILNGVGSFPKNDSIPEIKNVPITTEEKKDIPTLSFQNETTEDLFSNLDKPFSENPINEKKYFKNENTAISSNEEQIDKIVIFYKNGTFKYYMPQ
ncbi:MAG: helix-turn-helix transcriptional regulator [Bacteroidota bacterium]